MDIAFVLSEYYKGQVWTLNGDGYEGLIWHDENQTKPALEELTEKWDEHLAAQPLKNLREERNTRLAEVDWMFSGDYRVDIEMYQEWLLYRKALRDLPSTTEDPANPIWPKKPATANGKTVDYYERDTQSTKIILLQNVVNSLMKRIENLENP
tara:strand:+ start:1207 stop:1665 length:459 start_codon:yes stop_codon:yes gene_type:complete